MLKVLVVGQSPPPYGGQAIMIDRFVKSKMPDVALFHVRMGFSSNMNEVGRIRLSKIMHLFALIGRIIYHRFVNGVRILYYPPAGPDRVPMFRDIVILLSTRWLFDKTIFHFHSGGLSELYGQLSAWERWLFRRAYFGADAAIRISALNPEDGKALKAKREYLIPCGIDDPCPEFTPSPQCEPITEERPLRMLFVGILRESKGVMVLIEACRKLAERDVPFQLQIMGQWYSDEFAQSAKQRIQELKLDGQIQFLGVLAGSQKLDAYRHADVLCFPTFFNCETFGLVLVEAMAFGLPTVSTRWRGIPAVVDDDQTGFLVEPQDPGAVADRLAKLAGDAELRRDMGQAGRAKFLRKFTFAHHANLMRRALLETAGVEPVTEPSAIPVTVSSAA